MFNFKKLIPSSALALALSGCYTLQLRPDGFADGQVYFTRVQGEQVQHIRESDWAGFLFWGLVNIHQPDPYAVLGHDIGPGEVLSNLKIQSSNQFTDSLLAIITLGIYVPRTITYEADVVSVNQGSTR